MFNNLIFEKNNYIDTIKHYTINKELLKEFDAVIGNAVDKQIEESQDVKKLQSYPGYLADL
jgi:hypothetical protein